MAPKPNSLRLRAGYLKNLKDQFMSLYTKKRDRLIKEEIWKIAERNQNLLGCKTPSFVYDGKLYYNGTAPRYNQLDDVNRLLHPDLMEQVRSLLHDRPFRERVDEAKMSGLINNALIEAQHVMDINGMLKALASTFIIDHEIFNIGQPMPDHLIEKFKEDNKEGIQCLNEIALRELLLKKRR